MSINRREFVQSSMALAALSSTGFVLRAEAQAIDTLKVVTGFPPGGYIGHHLPPPGREAARDVCEEHAGGEPHRRGRSDRDPVNEKPAT